MLKAKEYHYFSNEVYKKKYKYGDYLEDSKASIRFCQWKTTGIME